MTSGLDNDAVCRRVRGVLLACRDGSRPAVRRRQEAEGDSTQDDGLRHAGAHVTDAAAAREGGRATDGQHTLHL